MKAQWKKIPDTDLLVVYQCPHCRRTYKVKPHEGMPLCNWGKLCRFENTKYIKTIMKIQKD